MDALNIRSRAGDELAVERCPACLLCGDGGRLLYDGLVDQAYGVPGRWSLRECANAACGLVWQDPMIVPQDLIKAYASYHTHDASGAGIGSSMTGKSFGRFDRFATRLLRLGAERRQFNSAYLHERKPGALLDVGCGLGNFAADMQRRGWTARGTDFDPKAARYVSAHHGFAVDVGELRAIAYPDHNFDAVTARHVIEHIREPFGFLRECWRILRPGGRLVLVTPNIGSLGHHSYQRDWRGLEPPRHLFLYGPRALRAMAAASAITPARVFSTAQGAGFLFRASEEIRAGRLAADGLSALTLLKFFRLQWQEVRRIRRGVAECGEELVLIADKPAGGVPESGT
jgi:2-polyprenyl-3-methyl-5-hydroxy-6-metoxy-1,4-benzoquinol methylase